MLRVSILLLALCATNLTAQRVPRMLRPGRIVGTITQQESGAPAVGATVSVVGSVFGAVVLPDGRYAIDNVPAGTYDLIISGALYRTTTAESILVSPSDSTVVDVIVARERSLMDRRITTAARRTQPIYEAASAVTVVDRDAPAFAAGHTPSRVLAQVPGITLDGQHLSLRGSGGGVLPFGSRVAVLVDGLPLISPDLGLALPDALPLSAIDHIELVRGSASALYGSGSIAGVVNLVTPRPVEEHRANASLHTGVYTDAGQAGPGWWGSQPLRYAGGDVMWTHRGRTTGTLLAASMSSDDGFRQNESRRAYNLFGRVNAWLSSGAEFRATALVASASRGPEAPWRGYDSALYSRMDSSAPSVGSFFSTVALEYYGVESGALSFTFRGYLQHGSTDPGADTTRLPLTSGTRIAGEVQLTSFLNRRISFVYGAQAGFDVASSRTLTSSVSRTVAGWGEMQLTNLYDIVATVGARADLTLYPGASQPNELQITPSVGVAYHPFPTTSLRTSIARGFRSPGIAERGLSTPVYGVPIVRNPELRSEQSWQGELGGSYREALGEITAGADVSFFVHEYFSLIEPELQGDGTVIFLNSTRARILGSELSGELGYRDGLLSTGVALSLTSARDLRRARQLEGRPATTATASVTWRPKPVTLRLLYRFAGGLGEPGAATRALVPDADRTGTTSTADLRASIDLSGALELPVSTYVDIHNLFGSRGYDGIGMPAPIRSVEVGAVARW